MIFGKLEEECGITNKMRKKESSDEQGYINILKT